MLNTYPHIFLEPGDYQMQVDAEINSGGLGFGVVDVESNQWIKQTGYHFGDVYDKSLVLFFSITKPGEYDLVLSNYATRYGEISSWNISQVKIIHVSDFVH